MRIGDRVKYREDERTWSGEVAGIEGNVVLLELPVPTPFLSLPEAIVLDAIDARMHLPQTKILGYGLRQALEDENRLPPGRIIGPDERLYELDRPMKIAEIKKFCKGFGETSSLCWLHGAMMTAVPIDKKSKWFGEFEAV